MAACSGDREHDRGVSTATGIRPQQKEAEMNDQFYEDNRSYIQAVLDGCKRLHLVGDVKTVMGCLRGRACDTGAARSSERRC